MAETIAAVATGMGRSAVGIVRLSGDRAVEVTEGVFRPVSGQLLSQCGARRMVYGGLYGQGEVLLDRCLAWYARGPESYTGEDTAEIQCHGSPQVLTLALEALFAAGARQAQPGEFTRRAFLNGRLDLTQAEAVMDLIDAETPAAALCAAGQLDRALSRRILGIYDGLVDVAAHFHAVLDYPDEDIDPFRAETLARAIDQAREGLSALLATWQRGRHLTDGVPCAIVGRPNAGKSSLLNALLGYERAIVTPVAGTTRDTVEERCTLGGVLLRLIDTAGLRESGDAVERMGVARSRSALARSELALLVLDGSAPLTREDEDAMDAAETAPHTICVVNKSDLPLTLDLDQLSQRFPRLCVVSARESRGLEGLEGQVAALFPHPQGAEQGELLTNARQAEAARRALSGVAQAGESLAAGMTADAVLVDLEEAMQALGELTGRSVRADVTDRIFSRFCVGK